MKKILGLDLGTNSIGWALVQQDFENKTGNILGIGSRIIPMDEAKKNDFGKGASISQTADRTKARITRRMYERHHLRRERLHRVLNVLGFLPKHYANDIDFEKRFGKFKDETETKLVWKKNGKKDNGKDKFEFVFQSTFKEMIEEFKKSQPDLLNRKNNKGADVKIPYDWTIYYLRKKALTQAITKEELAWLILNFNQKRGYYQRGEEENETRNKSVEFHSLKINDVKAEIKYILTLENNETYYRTSETPLFDWKNTSREFIVTSYLENDGTIKKDKEGKEKRSFFLKEDLAVIKKKASKSTKKKNEKVEEVSLKIIEIKEEKQEKVWYSLELEDGWIYRRESKTPLFDWKDKVREFIVTTDLNDDGTVKTDDEGKESRSYSLPNEDDWTLVKTKTENDLRNYIGNDKKTKTVGTYIYETLLKNPTQKIRGKLVRTIEREYYKDELKAILEKQIELQPKLFTDDLYNACVRELYRSNEVHQLQLSKRDFVHLFLEDIIFYQRPLRSQKSSIGNCSLESRKLKDEDGKVMLDKNGKELWKIFKAIPKSNPYYQEFRVWQWLYNLKIYTKANDNDVTVEFLKSTEDLEKLFEFLMSEKEVDHKKVLKYFFKDLKGKAQTAEIAKYRWNYVYDSEKDESKTYPMNETGYEITRLLKKANVAEGFLTREIEQQLWHIIYSVTDKNEYEKALKSFAVKYKLDETSFSEEFRKFKPFPSEYGAYSEKAIKKLLPLMRLGKYWNENEITGAVINRANSISERLKTIKEEKEIENIADDDIPKQILKSFFGVSNLTQGLRLYQASYLVYGRHSEAADIGKWNSVEDLKWYLNPKNPDSFKQHSLRNPIVEQVITETLRVVKDIWEKYGNGAKNFFDEIHIELGREMKNTAEERARMTKQISENENTNLRIKAMLMEFANDDAFKNQIDYSRYSKEKNVPDSYKKGNNPVRPYSQTQHDILKIYEEFVLNDISQEELDKETGLTETKDGKTKKITYKDISTKSNPTKSQIEKYKLWLEQKYRSPYTGQMISLTKLFTPEYQIEHIIPQSRYFDDSLSNKVICEAAINPKPYKDNQLGLEFIKNQGGKVVDELSSNGKIVKIFTETEYRNFVEEHYAKNKAKRTKLLLEEIPDKMIARQLNDTRYISKFVSQVLSNIVRADREDDGVNSKNLIPGNGKITDKLKQDWGLNDVWNVLILPRFERMNTLNESRRNELIEECQNKKNSFEEDKKKIEENNDIDDKGKEKHISDLKNKISTLERDILLTIFTAKNKEGHTIPSIPFELPKGFQKKRIDHRHHAMDALVIACATRDHVNLLNNQSAKSDNSRYDLQHKLRNTEKWIDKDGKERDKFTEFKKPWQNFTVDAKNELEKIVVSFKQNLRVINKATNSYEKFENGKKVEVEQKGVNWAIRKSLHTPMPYGKKIYEFDILKIADNVGKREFIIDEKIRNKVDNVFKEQKSKVTEAQKFLKKNPIKDESGNEVVVTAFQIKTEKFRRRQSILELANRGQGGIKTVEDAINFINKVGDFKIREDLLNHLKECNNDLEKAFSAEGIENFNSKRKIPVYNLPIVESGSERFAVGNKIGTRHKWVEADKGTNLFFAVYEYEEFDKEENKNVKKRSFETIPLNEVIEHQKQQADEKIAKENRTELPIKPANGTFLFHLSPNDLVYVRTKKEIDSNAKIDFSNLMREQMKNIYKTVSFSGSQCFFVRQDVATSIVNKAEFSTLNKMEKSIDEIMIKEFCIKLNVGRLGNISKAK